MDTLSGPALVLRRARHLDDDVKLLLFLRDQGKVSAISKGAQRARSKLKALHEPFSEIDVQLFIPDHGVHARMGGGKLLRSNSGIRGNMEAFRLAFMASETVDALLPYRAPSPDVFDILRRTLHALPHTGSPRVVWILFIVRLLKSLGHGDVSERTLGLLEPDERDGFGPVLRTGGTDSEPVNEVRISEASLARCLTCVDGELERVLPWRLKSESFAL